jgi:NAD(P)-dependent dehydrogenase (short-subunit alcohol dehydrogenase family)
MPQRQESDSSKVTTARRRREPAVLTLQPEEQLPTQPTQPQQLRRRRPSSNTQQQPQQQQPQPQPQAGLAALAGARQGGARATARGKFDPFSPPALDDDAIRERFGGIRASPFVTMTDPGPSISERGSYFYHDPLRASPQRDLNAAFDRADGWRLPPPVTVTGSRGSGAGPKTGPGSRVKNNGPSAPGSPLRNLPPAVQFPQARVAGQQGAGVPPPGADDGDGGNAQALFGGFTWMADTMHAIGERLWVALTALWVVAEYIPPVLIFAEAWKGFRSFVSLVAFLINTGAVPFNDQQDRSTSILALNYKVARAQLVDNPCRSVARAVAIVTGGNRGIGREVCLQLAMSGMAVVLACRNEALGKQTAEALNEAVLQRGKSGVVHFRKLDLGSAASIAEFARRAVSEKWDLSVIVCNGAVMGRNYGVSDNGYEQQMGVNHLGHALLLNLLEPLFARLRRRRVRAFAARLADRMYLRHPATKRLTDREKQAFCDAKAEELRHRLNKKLHASVVQYTKEGEGGKEKTECPVTMRKIFDDFAREEAEREADERGICHDVLFRDPITESVKAREIRIIFTTSAAAVGVMPDPSSFARAERLAPARLKASDAARLNPSYLNGVFYPTAAGYEKIDPNRFLRPKHRFYDKYEAYRQSKAAISMYAFQLNRYFADHAMPVTAFAYHPGCVASGMVTSSDMPMRDLMAKMFTSFNLAITIEEAATYALQLALSRDLNRHTLTDVRANDALFFMMGRETDQFKYFRLIPDVVDPVQIRDQVERERNKKDKKPLTYDPDVYRPKRAPVKRIDFNEERRFAQQLLVTADREVARDRRRRNAVYYGAYQTASSCVWDWTQVAIAEMRSELHVQVVGNFVAVGGGVGGGDQPVAGGEQHHSPRRQGADTPGPGATSAGRSPLSDCHGDHGATTAGDVDRRVHYSEERHDHDEEQEEEEDEMADDDDDDDELPDESWRRDTGDLDEVASPLFPQPQAPPFGSRHTSVSRDDDHYSRPLSNQVTDDDEEHHFGAPRGSVH